MKWAHNALNWQLVPVSHDWHHGAKSTTLTLIMASDTAQSCGFSCNILSTTEAEEMLLLEENFSDDLGMLSSEDDPGEEEFQDYEEPIYSWAA